MISADLLEVTTPLECDVSLRLELLDDVDHGRRAGGINVRRGADAVLDVAGQLERLGPRGRGDLAAVRRALLKTQTDRLCRAARRGRPRVMVGGRGVRLDPNSQVKQSEFFVALSGVTFLVRPTP